MCFEPKARWAPRASEVSSTWTSNPSASQWGLLCCSKRLLWRLRTGEWKVSLLLIRSVSSKISSPAPWTQRRWKIPRLRVSSKSSSQVASLQSLHLSLFPSLISDLVPGNWCPSGKGWATWRGWLCMLLTADPRLNSWRQHYDTKLPRNTTTHLEASVQTKFLISWMTTTCWFGRYSINHGVCSDGYILWLQIFSPSSVQRAEEEGSISLTHQLCNPHGQPYPRMAAKLLGSCKDGIRGKRSLPKHKIRKLK